MGRGVYGNFSLVYPKPSIYSTRSITVLDITLTTASEAVLQKTHNSAQVVRTSFSCDNYKTFHRVQVFKTLEIQVYNFYLLWAFWIPKVITSMILV